MSKWKWVEYADSFIETWIMYPVGVWLVAVMILGTVLMMNEQKQKFKVLKAEMKIAFNYVTVIFITTLIVAIMLNQF